MKQWRNDWAASYPGFNKDAFTKKLIAVYYRCECYPAV